MPLSGIGSGGRGRRGGQRTYKRNLHATPRPFLRHRHRWLRVTHTHGCVLNSPPTTHHPLCHAGDGREYSSRGVSREPNRARHNINTGPKKKYALSPTTNGNVNIVNKARVLTLLYYYHRRPAALGHQTPSGALPCRQGHGRIPHTNCVVHLCHIVNIRLS